MNLSFSPKINKDAALRSVEEFLLQKFRIIAKDEKRPWGGFFVIDETQSELFIKEFFADIKETELSAPYRLSPKILVVAPGKKLSWQYHSRRAELWKVIGGEVGIVQSDTDEENELRKYKPYSIIKLNKGERHRLIGLDSWGVVAEIWQHTDPAHPSDEEDIVRLQDDFGR